MKKRSICLCLLLLGMLLLPCRADAAIKLSKSSKNLVVTQSYKLKLKGTSKKASWTSANPAVATVSSKGKVKAIKAGSTVITAKVGSKAYSCKIKVRKPELKDAITVDKGKTSKISIDNIKKYSTITYKSTNKNIAKVSKTGVITGIQSGKCDVQVCFNKAYTLTIHVTVSGYVSSSVVSVMKGSTVKLVPYNVGEDGVYTVKDHTMGYVSDGIYHSTGYGLNSVIYKSGAYEHTFLIKNYCWEAHRGYHVSYPDNSLEAIRAAKAKGANSIEIDVRATKDGEFVLMHESNISKITNGSLSGKIKKYTLAKLQKKKYLYKNGKRYMIPTLIEALKQARTLGLNVTVEMKTLPDISTSKKALVRKLYKIIKTYGSSETSIIVQKKENLTYLVKYGDGTIPIRITNSSYASSSSMRKIAKKYSYVMSTTDYSYKHYKGYMLTQDYPIR